MSRLTWDGTAEPVSRDQILRREREQGNIHFPCSADHVQDWQPYPVDPYSCYMCDTYIHAPHRAYWCNGRFVSCLPLSDDGDLFLSQVLFGINRSLSLLRQYARCNSDQSFSLENCKTLKHRECLASKSAPIPVCSPNARGELWIYGLTGCGGLRRCRTRLPQQDLCAV